MATTLSRLLVGYVYAQLKDRDNKNRWTREELTKYVNLALRDIVARRPEAGVYVDTLFRTAPGALQVLPTDAIRLKELVENASFIAGGIDLTQTFSQQIDITAAGIQSLYGDVAVSQPAPSIDIAGVAAGTASAAAAVAQTAPSIDIAATASYPAWVAPTIILREQNNSFTSFFMYWPFAVDHVLPTDFSRWDFYRNGTLQADSKFYMFAATRTVGGVLREGIRIDFGRQYGFQTGTQMRFVYNSASGVGNPYRKYVSPLDYAASFDVTITAP